MTVVPVPADTDRLRANAYLLLGDVPSLVDAGARSDLPAVVTDHVDTLDRVVLTHQDMDHVPELDAVLDHFDADLYAHGAHPRRNRPLRDGDSLPIGDEPASVVHTPGHARDHVSFVTPTALFSGDVVVYADRAFDDGSFGRTDRPGQSREVLIDSVERLLDRLPAGVDALYPGHGPVYRASEGSETVRAVIERALARARHREPKYPEE